VGELEQFPVNIIARIKSDFHTKFGIPRQSGIVNSLQSTIIFEPEFQSPDALRGIEEFTHLWLIWQFSENADKSWSPTVRPPRLGGNTRMGVFATRSPFRPNPIGLSCVKLLGIEKTSNNGTVIHVAGADLMDGTPILDIKPYIPYADCHTDASGGFTGGNNRFQLDVDFPQSLLECVPQNKRDALFELLSNDPRPAYQNDPARIYGIAFAGMDIRFTVENSVLHVVSIDDYK